MSFEHIHYEPLEYKAGMQVFGEIMPDTKETLDSLVHSIEYGEEKSTQRLNLDLLKDYCHEHRHEIGDTIFHMYMNYYICLENLYGENDKL